MTTIFDLPDEIHPLIASHLHCRAHFALIRVCRFFYSLYVRSLWSGLTIQPFRGNIILAPVVRTNAHLVEAITFSSSLSQEYYTIDFPRLHTLRLNVFYKDESKPNYSNTSLTQKTLFARRHTNVRRFIYQHKDVVSKELWEVVGTEWMHLEVFHFSGRVDQDALEAFWRVCDRVQDLSLQGLNHLPETAPILSTLPFRRLQKLMVIKFNWENFPRRTWPLQLLEQVKTSPNLRRLSWSVSDIPFPIQRFQETLKEEGCWPELCAFDIVDSKWTGQDWLQVLRSFPSRRLTEYYQLNGGIIGPLTYDYLRRMHFGHLRILRLRLCRRMTSAMAQEVLTECVHLIEFSAPFIFVRDIATVLKTWGCLQLKRLSIYIAKEPEGEAKWEGRVFEQISRMRRLLFLDLRRLSSFRSDENDVRAQPFSMDSLDLRFACSRLKDLSDTADGVDARGEGDGASCERVADMRCWSSLVQLRHFAFSSDRKTFGMNEALWMVEHWKDLGCLVGHSRDIEGKKVKQLMTARGVVCY